MHYNVFACFWNCIHACLIQVACLTEVATKTGFTVQLMAPTNSVYDHFIIYPSSETLTFNLPEQMFQMALLLLKDNNCACIHIEVMAGTSSISDHFIIWPLGVTLTFNLPVQLFQIALLNPKDNNCGKLLWNPCISVKVMALTSSIYDHFIIWSSRVTLTFILPE